MVKWRIRVLNEDKHVAEMFDLAAGEDHRVFEIAYERVKRAS